MGKIKEQLPAKFFCAITFAGSIDYKQILDRLTAIVQESDTQSEIYDFDKFTDYYESQMGRNLKKVFVSFKELMEIERLPELKVATNGLEEEYETHGKRLINLDPGYITQAKLVLATTKNYSHRLYLGKGIFGDLHMIYKNKNYQPQAWTYPDYKQQLALSYFNKLRQIYKEQLALLLE